MAMIFSVLWFRWHGYFGQAPTTNGSVATMNSTTATYAPSNISLNQITTTNEKPKGTDWVRFKSIEPYIQVIRKWLAGHSAFGNLFIHFLYILFFIRTVVFT